MTHGELFAGIGGFGLGFADSGIETLWAVEINKNCQQVQRYHYPDRFTLDDVCTVGKHNLPYVDIISFGSPCQDLSIAGKRGGLKSERSGLFFEAIRIVRELKPAFAIWENVQGAFSSNSGRDFLAVLTAFQECGAVDIGWRVIDAQYAGVPQRRRRIFLVADFREKRVGKILFEPKSVRGNTQKSRKARENIAYTLETNTQSSSCKGKVREQHGTNMNCIYDMTHADEGLKECGNIVPSLQKRMGTGGNQVPVVAVKGDLFSRKNPQGQYGFDDKKMFTIRSAVTHGVAIKEGIRKLTPVECEILQGFPRDWTKIGLILEGNPGYERYKKRCMAKGQIPSLFIRNIISDSARYQMLGNAVNVAVTKRLGKNIVEALD